MWHPSGAGVSPPRNATDWALAFKPELDGADIMQQQRQGRLVAEVAACGPPRPPRGQDPLAAHPPVRSTNDSSNDSGKSFHTGIEQQSKS